MEAGGTELYTQGCHTLLVGVAESYAFHVVSQTLLLTATGAQEKLLYLFVHSSVRLSRALNLHLFGSDLQATLSALS